MGAQDSSFSLSKGYFAPSYFYMFATLYAERLNAIHKENKWNGWISFFLPATLEQARSNISRVQKINKLYGELKVAFGNVTKRESKYSYLLLYCILRCLSFLHFKSAETCWRGNPTFWLREFTILEQSHQGQMGQFTQKRKRKRSSFIEVEGLLQIMSWNTSPIAPSSSHEMNF